MELIRDPAISLYRQVTRELATQASYMKKLPIIFTKGNITDIYKWATMQTTSQASPV